MKKMCYNIFELERSCFVPYSHTAFCEAFFDADKKAIDDSESFVAKEQNYPQKRRAYVLIKYHSEKL